MLGMAQQDGSLACAIQACVHSQKIWCSPPMAREDQFDERVLPQLPGGLRCSILPGHSNCECITMSNQLTSGETLAPVIAMPD